MKLPDIFGNHVISLCPYFSEAESTKFGQFTENSFPFDGL